MCKETAGSKHPNGKSVKSSGAKIPDAAEKIIGKNPKDLGKEAAEEDLKKTPKVPLTETPKVPPKTPKSKETLPPKTEKVPPKTPKSKETLPPKTEKVPPKTEVPSKTTKPKETPEDLPKKPYVKPKVKKVKATKKLAKRFQHPIPKDPDPCPGVSAREHYPILRNRWFRIAMMLVIVGIIAVLFVGIYFIGSNNGGRKMSIIPARNSVIAEITVAQHEMPVSIAYYTGNGKWEVSKEWDFSVKEDSAVVWAYSKGGVFYYDEKCLSKIKFSTVNEGNLMNANSSLGPVTLSDDGVAWTVDATGEEIIFFSGDIGNLQREVSDFTAGGAEKIVAVVEPVEASGAKKMAEIAEPVETVVSTPVLAEKVTSKVVMLPVSNSNVYLFYNDGRRWKSLLLSEWDGNTSLFQFWNFGSGFGSQRYWDSSLTEEVTPNPEEAGNYFWGQDGKKLWDGSNVVDL